MTLRKPCPASWIPYPRAISSRSGSNSLSPCSPSSPSSSFLGADGSGRCPAVEIMMGTPAVRNLIRKVDDHQLYTAISTGRSEGMITMEQSLAEMVRSGRITRETASAHCFRPEDSAAVSVGPNQILRVRSRAKDHVRRLLDTISSKLSTGTSRSASSSPGLPRRPSTSWSRSARSGNPIM